MNQTQLKLKEAWEAILSQTQHDAVHGDHSSHSGYFNSESGYGEPPYTGDGLAATMDIQEWDEFMNDPLAMFDWDYDENMPELAYQAFRQWLSIQNLSVTYATTHLMPAYRVFVVQAFARDFYEVATGHDFEVVSL